MINKLFLLKDERGMALPLVLMVMIIVFTFGAAILTLGNTEYKIASNDYDVQKALYIAEAGLSKGISKINDSPNTASMNLPGMPFDFGGGQIVSVSITKNADESWTVTSTGKYQNVSKVVSENLVMTMSKLFALKDIQMAILENGSIDLGNKGVVTDKVYYFGTKPIVKDGVIDDSLFVLLDKPMPDFYSIYESINPKTVVTSDDYIGFLQNVTGDNTIYQINGNLDASNVTINYRKRKVLIVEGDFSTSSGTNIQPHWMSTDPPTNTGADFLMIIVKGNVEMKLAGQTNKVQCLIYTNNTASFTNANGAIDGMVMARNIVVANNGDELFYKYNGAIIDKVDIGGIFYGPSKFEISNWNIVR